MISLDGISEFVLQFNSTTIIDNKRRALVCLISIYYLLF